ncbi:MAG: four helix bundle protein [Anaerolineales bacterium]
MAGEAWRKRRYPKSFVSKLSDADAEAIETTVWLDFALHFGYLSAEQHGELVGHYNHICSQLALMMAEPEKWIPRSEIHNRSTLHSPPSTKEE